VRFGTGQPGFWLDRPGLVLTLIGFGKNLHALKRMCDLIRGGVMDKDSRYFYPEVGEPVLWDDILQALKESLAFNEFFDSVIEKVSKFNPGRCDG
jgi:hypothetical protein